MADGSVKIDVGLNISKAEKDLAKLREKINKAEDALNANASKKTALEEQIRTVGAQADEATRRVQELKEALGQTSNRGEKATIRAQLADATEEQRILTRESNRLNDEYVRVNDRIAQGTQNLEDMRDEAGQLVRQIERARPGEALAKGMETARKSLMKFLKYAIGIRSVYLLFRRLRSAIKDAVKSYSEYDEETKRNLKTMEATKNAIKTAFGAGLAGIYNAILPVVQKIANWMLEAANAASRFIAILSGKDTYKKAVINTAEIEASMEDTEEATKETKRQLMGFDELNILDRKNDGESSGKKDKTATDGVELIEEKISKFDDTPLNKIANWIHDHLEETKALVLGIGAALLAWKLSKLFQTDLLNILSILGMIAGAAALAIGAFDAWENGINWQNLLEMLTGIGIAALSAAIAFGTVGAAVALLVGGIVLLILGFKEWIETGELSTEAFMAIAAGIAAVAIGIGLLTGSWIPLLIAGVALLVLTIVKYGDEIKAKLQQVDDYLQNVFAKDWTEVFGPVLGSVLNKFFGLVKAVLDDIKKILDGVIDFIVGVFTGDWERAWKGLQDIFEGVWDLMFGWFPRLLKGLQNICEKIIEYLQTDFKADMEKFFGPILSKPILAFVDFWGKQIESLKTIFNGIIDFIAGVFTGDWERAWTGVREVFAGIFSGLEWILKQPINGIIAMINGVINGINWLIDGANMLGSVVGFSIPFLAQIPFLAKGGILKKGQVGFLEGDGSEAVVPIDQNTAWTRVVADGLMDRLTQANFANELATAFATTPLPAMAGGGVVPPNAYSAGYGGDMSAASVIEELRELRNAILSQPIQCKGDVFLDRRKVGESVTEYQRTNERARG